MTRTELKQEAQDRLMNALQIAFTKLADDGDEIGDDYVLLQNEMFRQMGRVEKLFGYEVGSWQRGC